MKQMHFKKGKLSVVTIVIMVVFVLMCTTMLFNGIWWGLFLLFPAIVIFSVKEGVYVDLEHARYKSYLSVFGITPAKWKPIPTGTKIGIRILKLVARRAAGPIVLNAVGEETTKELYLYFPNPHRVVLTTGDDAQKLFEQAQYIHQHLGYEIIVDGRIPREAYIS
jgi:hypothetical protein